LNKTGVVIRIRPRKVFFLLLAMIVLLVIAGVAGQVIKYKAGHPHMMGFVPKFNLDEENNIPTYFSSIILLTACILLAVIGLWKQQKGARYARHWLFLSIVFLFLSIDEAASIHELVNTPFRVTYGVSGMFRFAWVLFAIPLVVLFGISYLKFLLIIPKRIRLRIILAGILYVGGALGCELISGWYQDTTYDVGFNYAMLTALEETLEMIGVTVFIYALLEYICIHIAEVRLCIGGKIPTKTVVIEPELIVLQRKNITFERNSTLANKKEDA